MGIKDDLKNFGSGALKGATLGVDDEVGAGIQALLELYNHGKPGFGTLEDAGNTYNEALNENRSNDARAKAESPYSYLAGNVVGGIAPGLLTGGGGTAAGALKAGVGLGMANGLGNSDGSGHVVDDVLLGGATGALGSAAGHYGGQFIKSLLGKGAGAVGGVVDDVADDAMGMIDDTVVDAWGGKAADVMDNMPTMSGPKPGALPSVPQVQPAPVQTSPIFSKIPTKPSQPPLYGTPKPVIEAPVSAPVGDPTRNLRPGTMTSPSIGGADTYRPEPTQTADFLDLLEKLSGKI